MLVSASMSSLFVMFSSSPVLAVVSTSGLVGANISSSCCSGGSWLLHGHTMGNASILVELSKDDLGNPFARVQSFQNVCSYLVIRVIENGEDNDIVTNIVVHVDTMVIVERGQRLGGLGKLYNVVVVAIYVSSVGDDVIFIDVQESFPLVDDNRIIVGKASITI